MRAAHPRPGQQPGGVNIALALTNMWKMFALTEGGNTTTSLSSHVRLCLLNSCFTITSYTVVVR